MLDLPWDQLLPFPNVDWTTLLHQANLYWVPDDVEVVQPAPHYPAPHSSQAGSSFSFQPPPLDYTDLQTP